MKCLFFVSEAHSRGYTSSSAFCHLSTEEPTPLSSFAVLTNKKFSTGSMAPD